MRYIKFKKPELKALIKTAYKAYKLGNIMKFKILIEASFTYSYDQRRFADYLVCLFRLQKYKEFLYKFDKLDNEEYKNELLYIKALAYKNLGQIADSIELFEYVYKVLGVNFALYELAFIYEQYNEFEMSEKYYLEFLEKEGEEIHCLIDLGGLYEKYNNDQKALDTYIRALELDSTFPTLYYNMAVCQAKLGKTFDAINSYNEEIRINPEFSNSYLNLGLIYENIDLDKAIETYKKGIDYTNDSYLWYNVGCIYSRLKKYDLAKPYIEKSFDLDPELIDYSKEDEDLVGYFKEIENN